MVYNKPPVNEFSLTENPFEDDINNSNIISQTASTTSSFRPKSSNDEISDTYVEVSPDYLEMKNYVRNILKEHMKSEKAQSILKQIENGEQILEARLLDRPVSKNQKKK